MTERYGRARLRRSLGHFVLGKGTSAVAGLLSMLLVVRVLSVSGYAKYSTVYGLTEIVSSLANFGIVHVLMRYVPELYALHHGRSLRRFVGGASTLWACALTAILLAAWSLTEPLARLIGLHDDIAVLHACWLLVAMRCVSQFAGQLLEATLHQGITQLASSSGALLRLAGMAWLAAHPPGEQALLYVIRIETAAELLTVTIALAGVIRTMVEASSQASADPQADAQWLTGRLPGMARFAMAAYGQQLVLLPASWATHRVVGGGLLSREAMAVFGFAQSLFEYANRYLPAQLFLGLIRPIVIARYAVSRQFESAAGICRGIILVNVVLVGMALAVLAVCGSPLMGLLSGGKYAATAAGILMVALLMQLCETYRLQLEVLALTVERYHHLLIGSLAIAASVLLAAALAPAVQGYAFPLSGCVGLVVANLTIWQRLRAGGFVFHVKRMLLLRAAGACVLAAAAGALAMALGLTWWAAGALTLGLYAALAARLLGPALRAFVRDMQAGASAQPAAPTGP